MNFEIEIKADCENNLLKILSNKYTNNANSIPFNLAFMKILLFGEYSGLFNSLKEGLFELGHDVFLASNGDGYKNFPSDFRWDMNLNGKIGNAIGIANVFSNLKRLSGFDVVLVISTFPLFKRFFNELIFDFLVKNNGQVYLSGAGLTPVSFHYWNNNKESKYYNYTQAEIESAKRDNKKFGLYENEKLKESEYRIFEKISGYIPIMFEYAKPYHSNEKFLKTIPIPINVSKFNYSENKVIDKIVFFHGITRFCKGGDYIISAFDKLRSKYKNDAEFISAGGLPFDEYIALLKKTNVVLDDVNAYSLGMNGLYSMAQGKIVMGGAEEVSKEELNYTFLPAINLKRDVSQIIESIENVLDNRSEIQELGYKSRMFVEKHHDHIKVAKAYLDLWKNNDK
jgi:hypothetical protein